jgi:hypothetical protein
MPLYYAVANNNNAEIARFLLERGADMNAYDYPDNIIIMVRASSSVCPFSREAFVAYQETNLLLNAALEVETKGELPKFFKFFKFLNSLMKRKQRKHLLC